MKSFRLNGRKGSLLLAGALLALLPACEPSAPPPEAASPVTTVSDAPLPALPDGAAGRLAFVSERDGDAEVYLLDLADGVLRRLTTAPWQDYPAGALPPTGDVLIVSAAGEGPAQRERMTRYDLRADTALALAEPAGRIRAPAWSPDGRHVVYEADYESVRDLYRLDRDTGDIHRLTDNREGNFDPSFAPDGRHLVFASSRDGNAEIYRMRADGTQQQRLTAFHRDDWSPRWSPDGRHVAFLSNREGRDALYLMAPDGTLQRPLAPALRDTLAAETQVRAPTWSPDGRLLAFEVVPPAARPQLWLAEVATGRAWRVADALASASQAAWNPDGAFLAFTGAARAGGEDAATGLPHEEPPDLYLVRPDGTDLTRLTTNTAPDWLPRWVPAAP